MDKLKFMMARVAQLKAQRDALYPIIPNHSSPGSVQISHKSNGFLNNVADTLVVESTRRYQDGGNSPVAVGATVTYCGPDPKDSSISVFEVHQDKGLNVYNSLSGLHLKDAVLIRKVQGNQYDWSNRVKIDIGVHGHGFFHARVPSLKMGDNFVGLNTKFAITFKRKNAQQLPLDRGLTCLQYLIAEPSAKSLLCQAIISNDMTTVGSVQPPRYFVKIFPEFRPIITYVQGGPGIGKTTAMIAHLRTLSFVGGPIVFVICPTNAIAADILRRCVSPPYSIKMNNALSDVVLVDPLCNNMMVPLKRDVEGARDFSRFFIMTPNRACSPLWRNFNVTPQLLLIDEATRLSLCDFVPMAHLNFETCVFYGDHMQGGPYIESGEQSPVKTISPCVSYMTFAIPGYIKFLGKNFRMPKSYSELFYSFFYAKASAGKAVDLAIDCVSFLLGYEKALPVKESGSSYSGHVFNKRHLSHYVTPYLAQEKFAKLLGGITVSKVQGLSGETVLFDIVQPWFTNFIDNQMIVVALSRFSKHLFIGYTCPIPFQFFPGYNFDPGIDIWEDYSAFVSFFVPPTGEVSDYFDANGDFFLKWAYFIALLEYAVVDRDLYPVVLVKKEVVPKISIRR